MVCSEACIVDGLMVCGVHGFKIYLAFHPINTNSCHFFMGNISISTIR